MVCAKGHHLAWNTGTEGYGPVFSCDNCKKSSSTSSGRWNCMMCKYDICTKCRSPSFPNPNVMPPAFMPSVSVPGVTVTVSPGPLPGPVISSAPGPALSPAAYQCGKAHALQWSASAVQYPFGKFSCDLCKKSTDCANGRWNCQSCQYDICTNCRPMQPVQPILPMPMPSMPAPTSMPGQPFVSVTVSGPSVCSKSHPLQWSTDATGYLMGKYACDLCKKSTDCHSGRWNCVSCQYDVCTNCKHASGGSAGVVYPGLMPPVIAPGFVQPEGPAMPTACMGGHDPNGIGFNDYCILALEPLKQNRPVNISLIDIWTDAEQSGITYIWLKYEVGNFNGPPEWYDLEHGTRPAVSTLPHMSINLSNTEFITNIRGKYARDRITQLVIETTKGPMVVGRDEGIEFNLMVPPGKKVVALASEFTTFMKSIGAYYV